MSSASKVTLWTGLVLISQCLFEDFGDNMSSIIWKTWTCLSCHKELKAITQSGLDERIALHEKIHSLRDTFLTPPTNCDEVPMTRMDQTQRLLTGQVKDYDVLDLTDEDKELLKGMLVTI